MPRIEYGLPDTPYDEGYAAFVRREHYNANPYPENTPGACRWDEGWGDADMDFPGQFIHAKEGFAGKES